MKPNTFYRGVSSKLRQSALIYYAQNGTYPACRGAAGCDLCQGHFQRIIVHHNFAS